MDQLSESQRGYIIPCPVKCGMELFIHSQTWTLAPLKLRMDKYFHPALHNECNFISMLEFNHVNKAGPRSCCVRLIANHATSLHLLICRSRMICIDITCSQVWNELYDLKEIFKTNSVETRGKIRPRNYTKISLRRNLLCSALYTILCKELCNIKMLC